MAKQFLPDPKPEPKKKKSAKDKVDVSKTKEIETQLCECGCGEPTQSRFARGHQSRAQQKKKLSPETIHFIESSLLGDGYLSLQSSGAGFFGETHSAKHLDYVQYVADCLGQATTKHLVKLTSGHGSDTLRVTSRSYLVLGELKAKWYPYGKKELPDDLSWIDDFTVAKWYMDDGSLQGSSNKTRYPAWATNSFTIDEAKRLGQRLTELYGFETSIDVVRETQPILRARVGYSNPSLEDFWKAIGVHIHPSMRYKLPEEYHDLPFIAYPTGREILPEDKRVGGLSPKRAGLRVERMIAKELGEKRTVGSGAFKEAGLTGDVEVRDLQGRDYIKLEIKVTGAVNAAGEKVFSLKEPVLKQMQQEAEAARELGALVFHYKNGQAYVIMPFEHWKQMLEDAKLGRQARL